MFLFEDKNDLSLFVQKVRDDQRLAVHTALVPNKRLDNFQPARHINDLKKFGFSTYLREQIEAPDAILVYLCLFSQVYQLPVGNGDTHKNIQNILPQILPEITRCYTSTHLYSSTKSRYTGKISSQSAEVSTGYWLTSSVNQADLKNKEEELIRIKAKLADVDERIKQSNSEKSNLDKQLEGLKSELNKLKERRLYVENIGKKLTIKQTQLKNLETQNIDLLAEARKKLTKMNELAKKKVKVFTDCVEHAKSLIVLNKDKISAVYQEAILQAEKIRIQALERDYTARKQELESNHENYQANLERANAAAKAALSDANIINNLSADSKKLQELISSDEYKANFSKLPDSTDKLEMDIAQAEAIQQCSSSVDESVIKDFEHRAKRIEELKRDFEKKNQRLANHQNNYENTKNEWMAQVEEMIETINTKFSGLFLLLKCAGEVSLGRPDNPEDFSKYGICIKVSFRNDEQLQELTAWQQRLAFIFLCTLWSI
jgi:structural maintenance of chromosomes protein 5